ncbi:MAG: enoyl-CoA hydratase/isomerase family protein [Weeksellaceae bacterium]|nr:enoyl-CoA hydratase/isomerase family protein [Weeksellaceae bacterium]
MENSYVQTRVKDGIGWIKFYHEKSNSFPTEQLNLLIERIGELGEDEAVKVIVLESEGDKVFCAGASFDELLTIEDLTTGERFFSGFARVLMAMRDCPKFIIGKVTGRVVGGGVGLVAGCDYAIAHKDASVRLSELSIGIGPFVIEPAISRKIGVQSFSEMTLNPKDWKSAEWCLEHGLYNRVMESVDEVDSTVLEFASQLSVYSAEAMRDLKGIFWENAANWDEIMPRRAAMSGRLVLSDFTKETLQKFKNK